MRTLVLGATSLIGNSILRAALTAGWDVVAFDRPRGRRHRHPALAGLPVELADGRPNDPQALQEAMAGCQVVFHAAGYTPPNRLRRPRRQIEARAHIEHVLGAAGQAAIGRLVYSSSVNTIGRPDSPTRLPDEFNFYRLGQVHHPYWDSQAIQEEAVLAFGRNSGIPVVVLNPAQVIGPHDYGLEAAKPLLDMARHGARRYLPGTVSIADARDVAQGYLAAAERGRAGERYILAGHNITRQEMAVTMSQACQRKPPARPVDLRTFARLVHLSERLSCLLRPNRPFPLGYEVEAIQHLGWYDSAKAREELGYTNRPLIDTYRATLAWFKEVGLLR